MQINSGVKFLANLERILEEEMPKWIGAQRCIFNAKVNEDLLFRSLRKIDAKFYPNNPLSGPLDQQYSHFKSERHRP